MAAFYDEIEIEDMDFDKDSTNYYYPCPCGDRFQISLQDLKNGEEVARCPSCSLIIKVIYTASQLPEISKKEESNPTDGNTDVPRPAEIAAH